MISLKRLKKDNLLKKKFLTETITFIIFQLVYLFIFKRYASFKIHETKKQMNT